MRAARRIVIVSLLALGGCSSDDAAGPATTAPAETTTTAPAETAASGAADTTAAPDTTAGSDTAATTPDSDAPADTDPATSAESTDTTGPSQTDVSASDDTSAATTAAPDASPAASAGCAAPPTAGDSTVPFTSGGMAGTYILHVPATAAGDTPVPLVLDLHGYSEPAAVHVLQSGLAALGDTEGFVTVTPAIDRPVPRWDSAPGSPDVAWVGALLDQLESTLCVDTNRVFAAGLSNGAFMVSALACDLSERIAAVAPVAGLQAPDGCTPARPVPVIAFHGTADTFVPYEGGLGSSVADLPSPDGSGTLGTGVASTGDGPSVLDRTITWALRNGCDGTPAEEPVAADVTLLRFDCAGGADVELYRVEGGGHSWPGSAFSQQIVDIVGPTTTSIDASELMWAFFDAHPLAG